MWVWIVIGLASYLCLSILVAFGLAAILGAIKRHTSELPETDDWAMLPPSRAADDVREQQPEPNVRSTHLALRPGVRRP